MEKVKIILKNILAKQVELVLDDIGDNIKAMGDIDSLTDQDKSDILAHKKEIIEILKKNEKKNLDLAEVEFISLVDQQPSYPISDAQRRLWILSQFEGGSIAYNMPSSKELDGSYDIEIFTKAIDAVIERHEILRTVFRDNGHGEIHQWILPVQELGFKIDYQDCRSNTNKKNLVEQYIEKDSALAFDLAKGPLLRAAIFQLEDDQYVFYYNIHHIIGDGWSMNVLARDVMMHYAAFMQGIAVDLPALRVQYKDYAAWQLSQLQGEPYQNHREYWTERLSGELPLLELPSSLKRPAIKTYNGRSLRALLDRELTASLKAFSQTNGGTLFMGLLTSLKSLLHRYTGDNDLIVGSPIGGRDHVDLEDQIGFYVNTLPLRTQIEENESFTALFEKIKNNTLDAYDHQRYPFDRLVEDLDSGLKRDIRRSSVFDVLVALQNPEKKDPSAVPLMAENFTAIEDLGETLSKFDISFDFREIDDYISLTIEYNTDVYEQSMLKGFIAHLKQLLPKLLQTPDRAIGKVDYLSVAEKEELLLSFNDTKVAYHKDTTVVDLFEDQVKKTPDNIALMFGNEKLSYTELDQKSNQLAHHLIDQFGIQKGDYVGILMDRSDWLVVSVLGILKCGATYVPINKDYPESRVQDILNESNARLLIADSHHVFQLEYVEQPIFAIDIELDPTATALSRVQRTTAVDSLAYILYTSGTTGRPKGIAISHSALYNYLSWAMEYYVSGGDALGNGGLYSTLSFDLTITSLFAPLLTGSVLKIYPETSNVLGTLSNYLNKESGLDFIKMTPSHILLLKESGLKDIGVKKVIVGGEKLENRHIEILKNLNPSILIYNEYGPTETTVGVTAALVDSEGKAHPSIGRPVSNTQVYILGFDDQLQPKGVIGEICISGAGLAQGYLNRPELTAEKFVPNPFEEGLMYKTGDLGRWLPDGSIEFVGRKDDQVKLRGYRIELAEIEHHLLSYEPVKEAVVTLHNDDKKDAILVAYLVVAKEQQDSLTLRSYLKGLMPEYMVPSHYVTLEAMPLTANGKIDKKALPSPDGIGLDTGVEYIAARNEIEEQLVDIWQEVLGKDRIGVKDDFFDLGGHSLKATRLMSKYHQQFEVKLDLTDLFTYSVLEDQGKLLSETLKTKYVAISPVDEQFSYPISDAQRRLWVLSQLEGESIAYNMPSQVDLDGSYDIELFTKAIDAVIKRHEILRTIFFDIGYGEINQLILSVEDLGFKIDYKDFRSNGQKKNLVEQYIEKDTAIAFDLEKGPLFRVALLQLEDDHYVFYYNMHHIIGDGWSMNVLARDVMKYYAAFKENTSVDLPELKVQYKDYASWQLDQLQGESFQQYRQYWTEKLSGDLPVLDLPSSLVRPTVKTQKGRRLHTFLNQELTESLKTYAQRNGGTLFMGLLASLKALLHRYTGEIDLIVGSPIAGRDHVDLENQIGFYVNTLPLRTRIEESDSFEHLFEKIKKNTLAAYTHQRYPFDRLVEEIGLRLKRDISRSAVFDAVLVLQNKDENDNFDTPLEQEDLTAIEDFGNASSKFDFSFDFTEVGDCLSFSVYYNTDVYEQAMVEGFMAHYRQLLTGLLQTPEMAIGKIAYLSADEKEGLLVGFNDTQVDYPKEKSVVDLFAEQIKKTPDNIALVFGDEKLTYKELDQRSNQLARFLLDSGVKKDTLVGLLQNPGIDLIVSILGIIKAGGAYLPLDPGTPYERQRFIIEDSCLNFLIFDKLNLGRGNKLQWGVDSLNHVTCVDSDSIHTEAEEANDLMDLQLWDYVGEKSHDDISGGGWTSSYTGEDLSRKEMDEYGDNALEKLRPFLNKNKRVLEIGCSSGITMRRVAPLVKHYLGTDLSSKILQKTKKELTDLGHDNLEFRQMAAHEIDAIEKEQGYDIIILNSVVQCFSGYSYFREVLDKCLGLLSKNGILFMGDIQDQDKKQEFSQSLWAYRKEQPEAKTKTDLSSELFLSRDYFNDLLHDYPTLERIEFSDKIRSIENELTRFRYDAIIHHNQSPTKKKLALRRKYQNDQRDFRDLSTEQLGKAPVTSDALIYVIYTSGTTGQPKGVMIEHESVVNLCKWHIDNFDLGANSISTQYAGVSFDAFAWELFPSILSGSQIHVIPNQLRLEPETLISYLQEQQVTHCFLPTPVYENVASTKQEEALTGIKLLTGGSQLKVRPNPKVELYNCYGPTENTVVLTSTLVDSEGLALPSIGRPISNAQLYILGSYDQLQPQGVAGEICISGAGLARGYLNRPELTAEKFVTNPFVDGLMYKTGDFGRWLPDGNVEFVGRKDDQIKLRGYRIELGEIEHHLLSYNQVKEAVVILHKDDRGEGILVAYVVLAKEQESLILIDYLKGRIPEYMIPSHYVPLDDMPLTPNGKIDKKALPSPEGIGLNSGVEYIAPRNEFERELVAIWQELLGRDRIGIKDDFFDLGGHSLKATRLMSKYHQQFEVKLELEDLFTYTVLEAQGKLLSEALKTKHIDISPVNTQASYPISDAQRRLWVLSQIDVGSMAYNMPFMLELDGSYDIKLFSKAIDAVIERHEILRTVFRDNGNGEIHQWILSLEELGFKIDYKDYRSKRNRKSLVEKFINKDNRVAFDLDKGPLLRAALFQLEDDQYLFYYNMHHIIGDGWSMDVLSRDVFKYYQALSENTKVDLPELRIQYKDYASWQLDQLQGEAYENHRQYWTERFSGKLPVLDLPSSLVRPAVKTHHGRKIRTFLDQEFTASLKKFTQAQGGTLFMGLLASLKTLFYRYTGEDDFIVGSPIAGRDHIDLEDQIGFYINTLALRTHIEESDGFASLFEKIKKNTLAAFEHQRYPFDRLVEELGLRRDVSRTAVFDVMVGLQNTDDDDLVASPIEEEDFDAIEDLGDTICKFDVSFNFKEVDDYLSLIVEYNTDVYERAMVEGFLAHYRQLLLGLLQAPDIAIGKVEYLTADEKEELLVTFNDTKVDYPKDKTLIDLFEKQVEKNPDNIAVIFEETQLTYQALNEKANGIGQYLRKQYDIQADDIIALQLERSEWMIIAIMGVLKAGAAYLPIAPDAPKARTAFMLQDAKAKILLTDEVTYPIAVEQQDIVSIEVLEKIKSRKRTNLKPLTSNQDLAYIIYTSGSTGNPKGVMIEHRAVVNLMFGFDSCFYSQYPGPLHVALVANYTFDSSIKTMFGSLCLGHTLFPVKKELKLDGQLFCQFLAKQAIQIMDCTASLFHVLLKGGLANQTDSSLRAFFIGGEALPLQFLKLFYKENTTNTAQVYNVYGPTEATVNASFYKIPIANIKELTTVPIGQALPNCSLYIVSKDNHLQPIGIAGELLIGGAGLARGYLNNPELTAEKFISHPFKKGERLYKTGDLARRLPGGNIEFLGRIDTQVKIRGYRIELGEIEHHLLSHKSVKEAVVILHTDDKGDGSLVAYVVLSKEEDSLALRNYLKRLIPEYMVPAHYVPLDGIPLTPNGKINRKALPSPNGIGLDAGVEYIAPRNEIEQKLVEVWQEVLSRDHIGIKDDFFDLGGNSLNAIRIISRLRKEHNIIVKPNEFFMTPTIGNLSDYLESIQMMYQQSNKTVETDEELIF